jgi:hypothetical protein
VRHKTLSTDLRHGLRAPGYKEALLIADRTARLDALHARRLLDLPRIKMHWEQAGGHNVLRVMYLNGTLGPLLAEAAACQMPAKNVASPTNPSA